MKEANNLKPKRQYKMDIIQIMIVFIIANTLFGLMHWIAYRNQNCDIRLMVLGQITIAGIIIFNEIRRMRKYSIKIKVPIAKYKCKCGNKKEFEIFAGPPLEVLPCDKCGAVMDLISIEGNK